MNLHERLKAARLAAGMTQQQVADAVVPRMLVTQYNNYERPLGSKPSDPVLRRLATPLKVTFEYLKGEEEPISQPIGEPVSSPTTSAAGPTVTEGHQPRFAEWRPVSIAEAIDWVRQHIARLAGVKTDAVKLDLKIEY